MILPSLQYTVAEVINLSASQVSGDLLSPSAESSAITVNAGPPSVLTVESAADGFGNLIGNTSFRITDPLGILEVFAISRDYVRNFIANKTGFVWSPFEEGIASGTWVDSFASPNKTFYILVTAGDPAPADSP